MSIKQALIVGIDNYTTADALNYATHDAKEFASALGMQEYGFDSDLLLDSAATTSKLMTSISTLMRSSSRTKLFYFAGHGCANENGVYLVTTDDSYDEPGISLDWLRKQVMAATNTVIVILDCCHAGAASVRGNPTVRPIADADIDRSMGT